MSDIIDLTKKVQVVLDLRKIGNVKAQVCLCIDGSGSMSKLYRNGTVQNTVDRISAIAVKFDDNQELDVFPFSDVCEEAEPASPKNFGRYVMDELIMKGLIAYRGTNYVPFIDKVIENYFSTNKSAKSIFKAIKNIFKKEQESEVNSPKSDSGLPIYVIVITDGENFDQSETFERLKNMADKDIYWQFVGIGEEDFDFVIEMADSLPNVGFFKLENLETVKDMELYKQLINNEFAGFIKKFEK